MGTKGKAYSIILSILDIFVVLSLLAALAVVYFQSKASEDVFDISDGWTVELDGDTYSDVDLSGYTFPENHNTASSIAMTRTLKGKENQSTTIRVYTRLSYLQVDVDGMTVYHSGIDMEHPDAFVGMGYHFVQIPMSKYNQTIHIRTVASAGNHLTGLPELELTASDFAYSALVAEKAIGVFISIFIFIFGFVVAIISFLYTNLNRDYFRLFLIGSFALAAGLWCIGSQKLLQLFGVGMAINSTLEYAMLSLLFLPLLGFGIKAREDASAQELFGLRILLTMTILVDAVAFLLHIFNVLHYNHTIILLYLIALADSFGLICIGRRPLKEMQKSERFFQVGMIVVTSFGCWEVVNSLIGNFLRRGRIRTAEFALPLACLCFVLLLVVSYMLHLYDMVLSQAQEEALTKLAYNDALTGLYNRAKAEEVFLHLNEEKDTPYALINFDLNGLKKLNDEYGHTKGDTLISTFGHLLSEVFGKIGESMRMGGDEFITVIRGQENMDKTDELMQQLLVRMAEESKTVEIPIDSSYGIAYSTEVVSPDAETIFKMADERMYDMKVKSKKNRVD